MTFSSCFSSSISSTSSSFLTNRASITVFLFKMLPGFLDGLNIYLWFDFLFEDELFIYIPRSAFSVGSNLATAPLVILLVPFLSSSLSLSFYLSATTYSIGFPEKFHSFSSSIFDKFWGLLFLSRCRCSIWRFLRPYLLG